MIRRHELVDRRLNRRRRLLSKARASGVATVRRLRQPRRPRRSTVPRGSGGQRRRRPDRQGCADMARAALRLPRTPSRSPGRAGARDVRGSGCIRARPSEPSSPPRRSRAGRRRGPERAAVSFWGGSSSGTFWPGMPGSCGMSGSVSALIRHLSTPDGHVLAAPDGDPEPAVAVDQLGHARRPLDGHGSGRAGSRAHRARRRRRRGRLPPLQVPDAERVENGIENRVAVPLLARSPSAARPPRSGSCSRVWLTLIPIPRRTGRRGARRGCPRLSSGGA